MYSDDVLNVRAANERHMEHMIGAFLRMPFQALNERIFEGLFAAGYDDLRVAHFTVFQHMQRDGIRATELAGKAQMTKQSMGALVDYLEEHHYVERVPDPTDGRARIIRWTERGWAVHRLSMQIIREVEGEWARRLGPEHFAELRRLLQALVTVVKES